MHTSASASCMPRHHMHRHLLLLCLLLCLLLLTATPTPAAAAGTALRLDAAAAACDFRDLHPRRIPAYHLGPRTSKSTTTAPQPAASPVFRADDDSPNTGSSSSTGRETPAIVIDGRLDDAAWEETPWSEPFEDIRGARHWSQPWFATKVKLRFDDQLLYVGAYVEETAVWANVSARNDVVFADNDFEVFVDADGSAHNYKEFEVNAANTTWNLWLDRPYRDGGHENSTRVDPAFGFDMFGKGMGSAVYMKGTPNDPGTWCF